MVEPRRLVCRSLAGYLAASRGVKLGQEIGFATRYESKLSACTALSFVTPGIALRWYADSSLQGFASIILDEFHERRWDTDLLLAMLHTDRYRVVLTSATFAREHLAAYVQGRSLQAGEHMFPVTKTYTEQNTLPNGKNLAQRVHTAVTRTLRETETGDVLVFLPGRGEIQGAKSILDKHVPPEQVIALHASTDSATQDRVLHTSSKRRIILATNVAETSLTLPSVRVVVDSGLERRTYRRNGRTVLGLSVISRASAEQRAGRAGRLGPGLCLRLWGRQAKLETSTPPEILREDLSDLVLMAAACGHRAEDLTFPDPLPQPALVQAREHLRSMQAIDHQGWITEHGRQFARLPVEPFLGHLIAAMPDTGTKSMMIDISAALSVQGRILPKPPAAKDQDVLRAFAPEPCDVLTLIRCLRRDPPQEVPVNRTMLQEARTISTQLHALCGLSRQNLENLPRESFLLTVLRAAPDLLFVRREKRPQAMGNDHLEVQIGSDSRLPQTSQAALVFDLHSVPDKGTTKTLNIGTCLAPVPMPLLSQVEIGRAGEESACWDGERIMVEQTWTVGGRPVRSTQHEPKGDALCRNVSQLILEGRLFAPAGEEILEDIQAWNLAVHVGFCQGEQVDARDWLTRHLQTLGLQISEDLHLLDPEDFCFQGIPKWERKTFDRRFPRHLHLENLDIDVHYTPKTQDILLIKTGGIRKQPPTPRELPTWGRQWTVRFRDKSRTVLVD